MAAHDASTTSPAAASSSASACPGPQVVEGWYGQPYPKPLARTREYVEIVRKILAREEPVDVRRRALPAAVPGRHGARQAAEVDRPPAARRPPDLPRRRGAEERRPDGRDRRRLARRSSTRPKDDGFYRAALAEGFARPGARRSPDDFEVASPSSPIVIDDDVEEAADLMRPDARALHRRHGRQGGQLPLRRVRAHGLRGRGAPDPGALPRRASKDEAVAAVPPSLVEDIALVGPKEKIRDDLERWQDTCGHDHARLRPDPACSSCYAELVHG